MDYLPQCLDVVYRVLWSYDYRLPRQPMIGFKGSLEIGSMTKGEHVALCWALGPKFWNHVFEDVKQPSAKRSKCVEVKVAEL